MSLLLAAISGSAILSLLIWLVVLGLIYWIITWVLGQIGLPEPFGKIIHVVLVLLVAIFLINALLSLAGHGFISF